MRLINFKEILSKAIQLETPHLLVLFESAPSGATTLKIEKICFSQKCQFSPAGQSLIQPFLESFQRNIIWAKKAA